jgi:hypothetical protein
LDVVVGGGVEADVDAAAGCGNRTRVLLDRRAVEDVDPGDVSRAADGLDALGDGGERRFGAAGEVDVGALAGVRAGDRGSDGSAGSVANGQLAARPARLSSRSPAMCRTG